MKSITYLFGSLLIGLPLSIFSQIIEIPDSNFKNKLLNHAPVIDLNGDGEIQFSEAESLSGTLDIAFTSEDPAPIADITGIQAFVNIETLNAGYNVITEMDLTGNTALRYFNASGNPYSTLNFSNNPALEFIQSNFGNLTSLDISNNPQLLNIHVQSNQLSQISTYGNPLLQGLNVNNNPITWLDVKWSPMLRYFDCRGLQIGTLDASSNSLIISLDCQDNENLTYINLKNGNNEGMDINGTSSSCEFYNLPLLETVCLDNINSSLASYIENQVGHAVLFEEECLLTVESQNIFSVKIHPNPSEYYLNIHSDVVMNNVKIFNLFGQEILNEITDSSEVRLNLEHLASGIYCLQVSAERKQIGAYKIVKL